MSRYDDLNDVYEHWNEVESEVVREMRRLFRKRKPQQWRLMDELIFVNLTERAYEGILTLEDRKTIDEYCECIFFNYIQLYVNTVMVGHTRHPPIEYFRDEWKFTKRTEEAICEWIDDDAFSDYGLEPMAKLIPYMFLQRNYSLKVQLMMDIIGVTHCRGSLSQFFLTNGDKSLYKVDKYETNDYRYRERKLFADGLDLFSRAGEGAY